MQVYAGKPVLYRCRPGAARGGQMDLAAVVTKVNRDGSVKLRVFQPDTPDDLLLDAVHPMSQDVQGHCFHQTPDELAHEATVARVSDMETQLLEALERLDALGEKPRQAKLAR